jgi:hypothetical protein
MKTIILRHDFDWVYGLEDKVRLLLDIERKYKVRSTIFLRYDRGVSESKYSDFYKSLESDGWEFGLHLANHEHKPEYDSPETELEKVKSLEINILGVAACGGTYHWTESKGWIVQDKLGLKYVCPCSIPIPEGYVMQSLIAPNHLTLDGGYLYLYGDPSFPKCIKDFEMHIQLNGVLALLSHNTWFYKEFIPKKAPELGRMVNTKYYDLFIDHFINQPDYEFKTYKEYFKL